VNDITYSHSIQNTHGQYTLVKKYLKGLGLAGVSVLSKSIGDIALV
jgi:hypothetical protein